jgi:DnaJ-domain-containing protein 1
MTQARSTDRTFILQAMVSMAASNGDVLESEAATISTLYSRITGDAVSADEITSAPGAYRARGLTFAGQLAREHHHLSRETKETILRGAYMVLLAGGRVGARERKKLIDFVKAMKISEIHRGVIFEDVERTYH